MAPVLVAVAILGYMAGHDRSHAASKGKIRTIFAASVLLDYPSDWQRAAAASEIPGLSIAHPVVLAPDGDAAHAGLITGELSGGESSLLPSRFVARMRPLPETEVVDLPETQAYRYARLSIQGFDRMLSIYAIPNPGGNPTVLACYASRGLLGVLCVTCEQIVATLTLVGRQPSYDLAPGPAYARRLSASIAALDEQRVALRREMRPGASPLTVQRLATRLAAGFANAATSLSLLEPSFATSPGADGARSIDPPYARRVRGAGRCGNRRKPLPLRRRAKTGRRSRDRDQHGARKLRPAWVQDIARSGGRAAMRKSRRRSAAETLSDARATRPLPAPRARWPPPH